MRAFVMAAGVGARLGPLGRQIPKPLLPLGGVPLIRFALEKLRAAGVVEAAVNLHHRPEQIRAALGERACGIRLRYFPEPELLGTAGGIKNAEDFLRAPGRPFFVLNADAPCAADLTAALAHHEGGGFLATLILRRSPEAARYGVLGVDEGGRLRRFLSFRAPGAPRGRVREAIFTGQSVLSPAFLDRIPAGRRCGIAEEVYPALIESGAPLGAVMTEDYWADAGTPARYLDASEDLLSGRFVPGFAWPCGGDVLLEGPPLAWDRGRVEPPVLMGPGTRIGPGGVAGPFTVMMSDATLGPDARAARTVLLPGAEVAPGASAARLIAGPGARVGPAPERYENTVFLAEEGGPFPFS